MKKSNNDRISHSDTMVRFMLLFCIAYEFLRLGNKKPIHPFGSIDLKVLIKSFKQICTRLAEKDFNRSFIF